MRDLKGSRILVTGASSGIGLTVARRLVAGGARMAILSREGESLREVEQELGVEAVPADVRDGAAVHAAVAEAAARLGGLDAVVAAAGAAMFGPFREADQDDYESTLTTTLIGTAHTAHASLAHLEATGGTLVVIGSVAGRLPQAWLAAYAAAKHGVRGLIRSLASELAAQNSRVNVALIAPGPIDTPFWRRARSLDGRMPPPVPGAYRADDVADEVIRALRGRGSLERTVGGLYIPAMLIDALVPNTTLHLFNLVARLSYLGRGSRPEQPEDGLGQPAVAPETGGGLHGRRSLLQLARSLTLLGTGGAG